MNHHNLVHKFIPMLTAMQIPDAKSADKEWEQLEKMPAWQLMKDRNKKEVIDEARNEGKTVHFASLMDICHLKNSELEPTFQKYKGRIVLCGDIVKDDSGSCRIHRARLVSTTNVGRKRNGCHCEATRMCMTSRRRSIGLHPGQNGGCTDVTENSKVKMSRCVDTSTTTQVVQIAVQHGRPSRST